MQMNSRFTSLALLLAASASISAQETTGTLVGSLTNRKNASPVSGATLVLKSPKMLGERRVVTNKDGGFRISMLPNGDYTLSAVAPGFLAGTVKFHIIAGVTYRQDMRLAPEEAVAGTVVEVTSTAAQVDKTETSTQSVYTQETIDQLFSQGLMHAVDLAPGVVNSEGNAVIRGGNHASAKWLVNGLIANETGWGYGQAENFTINDMIESFNVIQSPLNARYGNTESGIISVVTTKGSNEFHGSLRVQYDKSWSTFKAYERDQADRLGQNFNEIQPGDDAPARNYQVTISGPIIKDRLTFAYGGNFTPDTMGEKTDFRRFSDTPNYKDNAGIFYRDPATGAEIHRAELYDAGKVFPDNSFTKFNQYVAYLQITPNHSLEYMYSETASSYTSRYAPHLDARGFGSDIDDSRYWTAGYKGVIGSNGLLEVRGGKVTRTWVHPDTPANSPIDINYYPTLMPDPSTGRPWVTGPVDARFRERYAYQDTEGNNSDHGDAIMNTSLLANYQHALELAGSHMFDIGFEYQKHEWDTQSGGSRYFFVIPGGRIATDLGASDILGGNGALNPADYAGKYIMWGENTPLYLIDPGFTNDGQTLLNSKDNGRSRALIPRMRVKMGKENGLYAQPTTSFWVNDLWTVNKHHSVMVGLRVDHWALTQGRTIAAYTAFSPRFEYKWDPAGDQARLLSFSAAKFHNRQPGGLFQPFVETRLAYNLNYRYTGPNNVHLMNIDQVRDPSLYTDLYSASGPGSAKLDPNWKNDSSIEFASTFRRNYANGGWWRATLVHRYWKDMFDWFPDYYGTQITNPYAPTMAPLNTFVRTLKADPEAHHTYDSLEFEWNAPITHTLTFGGNYTYARNMRHDTVGRGNVTDDPGANTGTNAGPNFRDYLRTYAPESQWDQATQHGDEHVIKGWLIWDLSVDKVKSNLGLTTTYWSGSPYSRFTTYSLGDPPTNLIPGYTDKGLKGGIPTEMSLYAGPAGGYTGTDLVDMGLKYNLELPVARGLRWWFGIEIKQPFNHIFSKDGNVGSYDWEYDPIGGGGYNTTHGWRAAGDNSGSGIKGRTGLRQIWVETGFKF